MDHGGPPTTPTHDPFWTAIGSAILSLLLGGGVAWREWRDKQRDRRQRQEAKAVERADETWAQARELRGEQDRRIARLEAERAELIHRDGERQARIVELEHIVGNVKMRLAAMTIRYNSLVRDLKARPSDEWDHLKEYPEPNGTHEVPKP